MLIGAGAAMQVLQILDMPFVGLAGLVICAASLGYCARRLGRSWVWGFVGIIPFVGAAIGFVLLATMKRVDVARAKPKPMSERQLKWGWIAYAVILGYFPLQVYLGDGLTCVWMPDPQYPPLELIEGFGCGVAVMFAISTGIFGAFAFLHTSWRAIKTYGVRGSATWLALRAVIVGMTLAYGFTGATTMRHSAELADSRTVQTLGQIKVGMPRDIVDRIVLEANAALVPPEHAGRSAVSRREAAEYRKVRDAMDRVQQGEPVRLSDLRFHRALFNARMDPLDQVAGPKPSAAGALYVRTCCQALYSWTRYDLFVEYDSHDLLESARYLRSYHADGRDGRCVVLMNLPKPTGKIFPYPCNTDNKLAGAATQN